MVESLFSNRISGLVGRQVSSPAPRTPAQQEASRRNGSRSRGPVTDEGKARSAQNALKHGLLARAITPPADLRGDDVLYRKLHRGLLGELRPATLIQHNLVDCLAHDLLQLGRARAMSEALLQGPKSLSPDDEQRWQKCQAARRDRRAIQKLMTHLRERGTGNCRAHTARRLAKLIVEQVQGISEYLNPGEEVTPEEEMDDFERAELLQMRGRWALVEPVRARLSDPENVVLLLRGLRGAWKPELKAIRQLLEDLREHCLQQEAEGGAVERAAEQGQAKWLRSLAEQPEKLLLLQRYTDGLERSIRLKLAAFGRPGALGSFGGGD